MKKIFTVVCLVIMFTFFTCNVFATIQDPTLEVPNYSPDSANKNVTDVLKDVWATVSVIVQIVAVGAVVFAGLRYMFASADHRADIKKGLIYICIGAVLVFGTVSVIRFVTDVFGEIMMRDFSNGYAAFTENGKWGFVNEDMEEIEPAIWDEVYDYSKDGYAVVRSGDNFQVLDNKGDWIISGGFNYKTMGMAQNILKDKGLGLYSWVDESGKAQYEVRKLSE